MATTKTNGSGTKLTKKEFATDQDVRWCPGCGDYAILKGVQSVMPDIYETRENVVFVSGIGCSSRFPYYMNTYGMHSIHGRAPAIASGLKVARPDLQVWVATGDGDGLSIGGNHLLHAIRRNIDINILLFNNRIYGLTKGQYSPTSELGKKAKSTPLGSIDNPVLPLGFALGASATFVARCVVNVNVPSMQAILKRAADHKGTAFIEILQNCNVFNDGAFFSITDRKSKADTQLALEHGKPLVFGKNKDKGIRIAPDFTPEVVHIGDGPGQVPLAEIAVHDEDASPAYAFMLAHLDHPQFPVPIGIVRATEAPTYDAAAVAQFEAAREAKGKGDLSSLLKAGTTWEVP